MAIMLWNTRCSACNRVYSRHRLRCPECRRKNPHTLGKLLKILFIILALVATVMIWIATMRKSGWWSTP